jgi:poly(hydroxyalkanoate) granule-associated protein
MVKKMQRGAATGADDTTKKGAGNAQFAETVKESASQIWLAGLGAFGKAQAEGGKVFEALVREGMSLQRRTQSAAEEKLSEATTRMASMAGDLSSKASGQWDKLETIFEERVSRALNKLGVPSAKDVDALIARIDELHREVAKLNARGGRTAAKTPRPAAGKKAPAKKRSTARKSAA